METGTIQLLLFADDIMLVAERDKDNIGERQRQWW